LFAQPHLEITVSAVCDTWRTTSLLTGLWHVPLSQDLLVGRGFGLGCAQNCDEFGYIIPDCLILLKTVSLGVFILVPDQREVSLFLSTWLLLEDPNESRRSINPTKALSESTKVPKPPKNTTARKEERWLRARAECQRGIPRKKLLENRPQ
jgi:hypothetical protein